MSSHGTRVEFITVTNTDCTNRFFIVIWDFQLLSTVCLLFWLVLIAIQTQRIHFSLPPTKVTNIFSQQSEWTGRYRFRSVYLFFLVYKQMSANLTQHCTTHRNYTRWKIWLFLSLVPSIRCCERVSLISLLQFDRTKSTHKFRRKIELEGPFVSLVLIFRLLNRLVDTQNTM